MSHIMAILCNELVDFLSAWADKYIHLKGKKVFTVVQLIPL